MTRPEAHALLDAVRAGATASRRSIDLALMATGDLAELAWAVSAPRPAVQLRRAVGSWERAGRVPFAAGPFDGLLSARVEERAAA